MSLTPIALHLLYLPCGTYHIYLCITVIHIPVLSFPLDHSSCPPGNYVLPIFLFPVAPKTAPSTEMSDKYLKRIQISYLGKLSILISIMFNLSKSF